MKKISRQERKAVKREIRENIEEYNRRNNIAPDRKKSSGCLAIFLLSILIFGGGSMMVNEVFNYADYLKDKQQVEAEAKPSPKPSQKPSQPSSNPAPENPAEKPAKKPSVLTKNTGWESSVKKIASDKSKSKTEKYEAVMKLVNKNVMKQDAGDFFLEMVQDYSTQKYLSKPKNDVYMLEQIYKSGILNKQGDMLTEGGVMTRELLPMYQFSFDYWQNVKYVYRGVDKIDSEAVLSNETQMFKSLLEAGNLNQ